MSAISNSKVFVSEGIGASRRGKNLRPTDSQQDFVKQQPSYPVDVDSFKIKNMETRKSSAHTRKFMVPSKNVGGRQPVIGTHDTTIINYGGSKN